jgi:hypothetical protein
MKIWAAMLMIAMASLAAAQDQNATQKKEPATLRSILLDQLHTTHDTKDWFVDANTAVGGLTAEQASWRDSSGNHSVGQLAYHLVFWNRRALIQVKGQTPDKFSGNNEETFDKFDAKQWADLQSQLDQVMKDWESFVQTADEKTLQKAAPTIARIGTHNAYHIGQIVVVRKENKMWDPEKGVK